MSLAARILSVCLLIVMGAWVTPARAQDASAKLDTDSPAYAKASAHDPHYADKNLWPNDVEKTDYYQVKWPPARLLVWAHPDKVTRGLDPSDAANWLENNKPASKGPDGKTDVLFPAGSVVGGVTGSAMIVRHITLEPGAKVSLRDADIEGNLWIKKGASFTRVKGVFGGRDKSNFCRCDNDQFQFINNMLIHSKQKDVSTEWIGKWKVGDEVNLFSGIMIIAPGSTFLPTDRRSQHVYPDAKLVLLSGSTFHLRGNLYGEPDIEIKGQLLAGTPKRPLTSDCTLGLSFKSKGHAKGLKQIKSSPSDPGGLVLHKEGTFIVHSADPKTARLVFNWHRRPNESFPLKDGEPEEMAALPHGIEMVLLGEAQFNGVEFDDVIKGGIHMADPAMRSTWKNITFGSSNFGKPDELFAGMAGVKINENNWGRGRLNPSTP